MTFINHPDAYAACLIGLSTYEHTTKISTGHPKSKATEDNLLIVNQNCSLNRLGAENRRVCRVKKTLFFQVFSIDKWGMYSS
jgi:hypothetical protein